MVLYFQLTLLAVVPRQRGEVRHETLMVRRGVANLGLPITPAPMPFVCGPELGHSFHRDELQTSAVRVVHSDTLTPTVRPECVSPLGG